MVLRPQNGSKKEKVISMHKPHSAQDITGSVNNSWPMNHQKFLWCYYALIFMGVWLIANFLTFKTGSKLVAASDIISGLSLIVIGYYALSAKNSWAPWAATIIGIWLQFAPLLFWAETSFHYFNDTISGIIVIALAILIPGTPGEIEDSDAALPLGWSYNPSAWSQRIPIVALTIVCWFCSRYMAAYQLGYIDAIWDPVFPNGTLTVITSSVSKAFPVSDAGLGAFVYTIEALMGLKGGVKRWRTMPWIVALFGILVVPAGLTSIVLIMLQPLLVGAWCFWCLLTAACMLVMIALTIDEVVASVQYILEVSRREHSVWPTFWHGGPALDRQASLNIDKMAVNFSNGFRGISIPWNMIISIIIGVWLLFNNGKYTVATNIGHIIGALVITCSIISLAEVARTVRFANLILGAFVIAIAFIAEAPATVFYKALISGALLIALSFFRGPIKESYGTWQESIR